MSRQLTNRQRQFSDGDNDLPPLTQEPSKLVSCLQTAFKIEELKAFIIDLNAFIVHKHNLHSRWSMPSDNYPHLHPLYKLAKLNHSSFIWGDISLQWALPPNFKKNKGQTDVDVKSVMFNTVKHGAGRQVLESLRKMSDPSDWSQIANCASG